MSKWGKSSGWVVAILVLFLAAASCAKAAILDNIHSQAPKAANASRNAQPTSSEGILASSNALAGGIGATLTLLSLGSLGYAWRRNQKADVPREKVGVAVELLL